MRWPWTRRRAEAAAPPAATPARPAMRISEAAIGSVGGFGRGEFQLTPISEAPVCIDPFRPAPKPPGVGGPEMAYDDAIVPAIRALVEDFGEGIGFLGFPYLAELAQRPEYRKMSETLAKEMTREWIELFTEGDTDTKRSKAEKLRLIETELDRLGAQDAFRRVAELDGFFGRGQIYLDTGATDDPGELATPLRLVPSKIKKGGLKRLKVIEPVWTYPAEYDSTDPLKPTYYKPQAWYVMAKKVHHSRLLTFVGREVPDILKPAYSFGGLSMSQMAKPYVDNWLRTRQSVSDLLHSFTVFVLKTDMSTILSGGGADTVVKRAKLFNMLRNIRGLMMLNQKRGADDGEELTNVSAPLGTLDKLQDQSLEQLAFVSGTPLVKLLGTTPSGLNASSDGEIRVFYDFVAAFQEQMFKAPMEFLLGAVQLSLFGSIDPDIGFRFKPLWQESAKERADRRKTDSETDCNYTNAGVLDRTEVRRKLANDDESGYDDLDVEVPPEDTGEEGDAGAPTGENGLTLQEVSLNGAQVASMVDVVAQVAAGQLPRTTGVEMLRAAFPLEADEAEKIMGDVGRGFAPAQPAEEPDADAAGEEA